MAENRSGQSTTVLDNGQVLIAGGLTGNLTLRTAEIARSIYSCLFFAR